MKPIANHIFNFINQYLLQRIKQIKSANIKPNNLKNVITNQVSYTFTFVFFFVVCVCVCFFCANSQHSLMYVLYEWCEIVLGLQKKDDNTKKTSKDDKSLKEKTKTQGGINNYFKTKKNESPKQKKSKKLEDLSSDSEDLQTENKDKTEAKDEEITENKKEKQESESEDEFNDSDNEIDDTQIDICDLNIHETV